MELYLEMGLTRVCAQILFQNVHIEQNFKWEIVRKSECDTEPTAPCVKTRDWQKGIVGSHLPKFKKTKKGLLERKKKRNSDFVATFEESGQVSLRRRN